MRSPRTAPGIRRDCGGNGLFGVPPPGSVSPDPLTLELLGALLSGRWERARESQPRQRREADGIVAAYVQWHLERTVRSLRLVDRTRSEERRVGKEWRGRGSSDACERRR